MGVEISLDSGFVPGELRVSQVDSLGMHGPLTISRSVGFSADLQKAKSCRKRRNRWRT